MNQELGELAPLVSVVIPAYNNAKYIEQTVASVLAQSWTRLEVVVVDDHSSDETLALLQGRFPEEERLRLIKNPQNLGMVGNWNQAVREARGELVKLLCADDLLYPDCIREEAEALLSHPDCVLACSDSRLIGEEGQSMGVYPRSLLFGGIKDGRRMARFSLIWQNFFGGPLANLFRKKDWEAVGGFDGDFPYILDFDLWLKLAVRGKVFVIRTQHNGFRLRAGSNTDQVIVSGNEHEAYVREHARLVKKHAAVLGMGKIGCSFSIAWRRIRSRLIGEYVRLQTFFHRKKDKTNG